MVITQAEIQFLQNAGQAVKTLLAIEGNLDQLNVLWAGSAQYITNITANDLLTSPAFKDLSVSDLAIVMDALISILNIVKNTLPSLTSIAYNT